MDDESKKEGKGMNGQKEAMDYANILIDVEKKENKNLKKPKEEIKEKEKEEDHKEEYGAIYEDFYPMPRDSGLEIYSLPVKKHHEPEEYTKIIVVVDEFNHDGENTEKKHIETKLDTKRDGKEEKNDQIMVVIDVLEEDLKKHQKEEKMKTHG